MELQLLAGADTSENTTLEHRSPPHPPQLLRLRLLHAAIFVIRFFGPFLLDLIWECLFQYAQVYPLSALSRTLRSSSRGWDVFWVGERVWATFCVAYNTFLVWSVADIAWRFMRKTVASASKLTSKYQSRALVWVHQLLSAVVYLISLILIVAFITGTIWWRGSSLAIWRRTVWRNGYCEGWDYLMTINTLDYAQLLLDGEQRQLRSNATLLGVDGSEYTMQLEHPNFNISLITVHGNVSPVPDVSITYNFTSLTYFTSSNMSGDFTYSPFLSFPDLSIHPTFPNTPWACCQWQCTAPSVALTDSDREIARTIISNYDDCRMLKVCGMGTIDSLGPPLGAILIEMERSGLCCTNPQAYCTLFSAELK
jgi:hypothetical protein